jgi:hypothetical protein
MCKDFRHFLTFIYDDRLEVEKRAAQSNTIQIIEQSLRRMVFCFNNIQGCRKNGNAKILY